MARDNAYNRRRKKGRPRRFMEAPKVQPPKIDENFDLAPKYLKVITDTKAMCVKNYDALEADFRSRVRKDNMYLPIFVSFRSE